MKLQDNTESNLVLVDLPARTKKIARHSDDAPSSRTGDELDTPSQSIEFERQAPKYGKSDVMCLTNVQFHAENMPRTQYEQVFTRYEINITSQAPVRSDDKFDAQ